MSFFDWDKTPAENAKDRWDGSFFNDDRTVGGVFSEWLDEIDPLSGLHKGHPRGDQGGGHRSGMGGFGELFFSGADLNRRATKSGK